MDEFLCGFLQEQANKAIETARESLRASLETRSAFNDYKNDCVSEIDYATLEIAKLSQLVELVFNLLGVNIYDENDNMVYFANQLYHIIYKKRKNNKFDEYFTKPDIAKRFYEKTRQIISKYENIDKYFWLEPSVGDGCFYTLLDKEKRIGLDIKNTKEIGLNNFNFCFDTNK